ncbi:MAG: site-2 protease family protein [Ignavibacteria bacterium]|jgi:Zn-dependent protease|nr:site-2 protease family protein [Ignavibacteria bacterium]MDH7526945.1 site-2 protease family protein [Ignavibacteria bacterium]NPV10910.1 site-2 protease family protein [Ignavibacteria bacterium]
MENITVNYKLILFLLFIPIFLISIAIHEFSHAFFAYRMGDPTAKNAGRLTLNPIKHIDLIGTIIIPIAAFSSGIALIGWAKPVPINPNNFNNKRVGDAIVSFVGPFSNFLFAFVLLILILILPEVIIFETNQREILLSTILKYGIYINLFLFLFNLLPIPPLDGMHIVHSIFNSRFTERLLSYSYLGPIILLIFIYSPLWKYFNQVLQFLIKIFLTPVS